MTLQFKQALTIGSATIQLADNGSVVVAIHLEQGSLVHDFSMQVPATSGELENLKLKAVDFTNPNARPQYVVQQSDTNGSRYLVWDDAHEVPEARSLREAIGRIGHLHYAVAITSLQLARLLRAEHRQKPAITVLQFGIDTLDDRYSHAELVDDTPTKWALALHNLQTDKLAEAEVLFDRVLESRTETYKHHFFPSP